MTAPGVPVTAPEGFCARWLGPLRAAVPELTGRDWGNLAEFEALLRNLLAQPAQGRATGQDAATDADADGSRSEALMNVRRSLAPMVAVHDSAPDLPENTEGLPGTAQSAAVGRGDLRQTLRQAICGYYDLDQRDATGPGHGRMILRHAVPQTRQRWADRLRAGELAGIAMTEKVGGTQVHAISTALVPAPSGDWRLIGAKQWISRLTEASVFVVFARAARGGIAAIVVDADTPGIRRDLERPTGLRGWSWGRLTFDHVPIAAADVLSGPGLDGLVVFTEHFAHYRALVTATALGAAAAAHDTVSAHLADRQHRGEIGRVRDHALITVGRAHAQINSGLLATLHTQRLAALGDPAASLWARTTKALGVDLAREAADQLSVLMGATGFTAEHRLQKIRRDLDALRYADGMHDSLNRSAGRALLATAVRPDATTSDARLEALDIPSPRRSHDQPRPHGPAAHTARSSRSSRHAPGRSM